MLGAIIAHDVMDCGSNLEYDPKVIEKNQITFGDPIGAGIETMMVTGEGINTRYEIKDLRGMNFRMVWESSTGGNRAALHAGGTGGLGGRNAGSRCPAGGRSPVEGVHQVGGHAQGMAPDVWPATMGEEA